MNKKIVFFVGSMNWGGAEKVISVLANSYANDGWSVTIVCLLSDVCVYSLNSSIHLECFKGKKRGYIKNTFFWINSIKNFLKSSKPDIVVSFVCRINILVLLAKKMSKIKTRVVISERNDPEFDGRGKLAVFLANRLYPRADLLICQSNKEKIFFNKKTQKNAIVIKNPIQLFSNPIPFEKKQELIVNVARLEASKNQELLIRVFSKIVKEQKNNNFHLTIFGNGPLKEHLLSIIDELDTSDYINIEDSTILVHEKLSAASIFCLSSNYEGMSNALMEAMALGTPSISTAVSGSDDLITDSVNGFIVPVNNPDALYEKMLLLISNTSYRKKFYNNCLSLEFQEDLRSSLDKYKKSINGGIGI